MLIRVSGTNHWVGPVSVAAPHNLTRDEFLAVAANSDIDKWEYLGQAEDIVKVQA